MSLQLTKNAADKLRGLIAEENNPDLKLRIFVSGGGCSGFQYGFSLDDQQQESDQIITSHNVTILVDAMSIQYLGGSEIDYVEDLNGAQFTLKNPNAANTCGCGQSFTPKTDGGGCAYS